ncbi:MAG: hypothetical protein IIT37_06185, partial [Bacteroidales bacterium]|nr:hypothetical protein [Bacteroidales bacterium]
MGVPWRFCCYWSVSNLLSEERYVANLLEDLTVFECALALVYVYILRTELASVVAVARGIADLSSHEISAEELRSTVEAELGRMLFDVCATPSCGSLDDRGKEFRSTACRWLELQFP